MITIDLRKTNDVALRSILTSHAGLRKEVGRSLFQIKKGVGGFVFRDKVGHDRIDYKVNLELYPEGIGVYCRSRQDNFLVILPFTSINHISVVKEADELRVRSFSWFRLAMKIGMPYEKVRFLVLDHEWISAHPLTVTFLTNDNRELKIVMSKIRSSAVNLFFSGILDKVRVNFDVKTFIHSHEE